MFVTIFAFEWELLVVQFLVMMPSSYRELYSFRKPDFQIYFDTKSYTGILAYVISFVYESTQPVSNLLERLKAPVMGR